VPQWALPPHVVQYLSPSQVIGYSLFAIGLAKTNELDQADRSATASLLSGIQCLSKAFKYMVSPSVNI